MDLNFSVCYRKKSFFFFLKILSRRSVLRNIGHPVQPPPWTIHISKHHEKCLLTACLEFIIISILFRQANRKQHRLIWSKKYLGGEARRPTQYKKELNQQVSRKAWTSASAIWRAGIQGSLLWLGPSLKSVSVVLLQIQLHVRKHN